MLRHFGASSALPNIAIAFSDPLFLWSVYTALSVLDQNERERMPVERVDEEDE